MHTQINRFKLVKHMYTVLTTTCGLETCLQYKPRGTSRQYPNAPDTRQYSTFDDRGDKYNIYHVTMSNVLLMLCYYAMQRGHYTFPGIA
jgi:hypothetical protein